MSEPETKQRLDIYVASQLSISRSVSLKLIEGGHVSVNKQKQTKPSYSLKPEDVVKIDSKLLRPSEPKELDLEILYEDNDCVVITKPVGILSHSKGDYNPEASVASWAKRKVSGLDGNRAGIVHRLDRLTSGVMIIAKNPEALSWLQKQFSSRKVKKTYVAIVKGKPNNESAIIDMPIGRNPKKPQTFRVDPNGKSAITTYKVLKANDKYALVELTPKTGRTHQLRVHLKEINHPILGDELYGGEPAARMYLHAKELELTLPNRERRVFSSSLPKEFNKVI